MAQSFTCMSNTCMYERIHVHVHVHVHGCVWIHFRGHLQYKFPLAHPFHSSWNHLVPLHVCHFISLNPPPLPEIKFNTGCFSLLLSIPDPVGSRGFVWCIQPQSTSSDFLASSYMGGGVRIHCVHKDTQVHVAAIAHNFLTFISRGCSNLFDESMMFTGNTSTQLKVP